MRTSAALEVEDSDALIAIDFLVDNVNLSKSRLKKLMNAGGVWLRRGDAPRYRLRRAMTDLKPGDVLEVFYDQALLDQPLRPSECLQDCEIYSVWAKPAGVFCTGSDWGDHNTLQRQAELHFNKQRPVWLVNAVPAAGRGLILASHHKRASAGLEALWDSGALHTHWRLTLQGDQRPRLQQADGSLSPLAAEAAQSNAVSTLALEKLAHQAAAHNTRVEVSGRGLTARQLLQWAGELAVSLPCAGESAPAVELLAPPEEEGAEDPAESAPLELIGLSFDCPFTGESRHYRL